MFGIKAQAELEMCSPKSPTFFNFFRWRLVNIYYGLGTTTQYALKFVTNTEKKFL